MLILKIIYAATLSHGVIENVFTHQGSNTYYVMCGVNRRFYLNGLWRMLNGIVYFCWIVDLRIYYTLDELIKALFLYS